MFQTPAPSASALVTLAIAPPSPSAAGAAGPTVGRSVWDFFTESSWVLLVLVPVVVLFAIIIIFAVVMSRRATREGRSFHLIPPSIGPKDGDPVAREGAPADSADAETPLLAALEIARHGHAIALAKDDAAAAQHEAALLNTLVVFTTPGQGGVRRRASVLELATSATGEPVMRVRKGSPEELFKTPYKEFAKSDYKRFSKGMCWAAVDGCLRAMHANKKSLDHFVLSVDDVREEASYVEVAGHHPFESILIAPILFDEPSGDPQVLGVVCIDSEKTEHYRSVDGYMLALAAAEIGAAWRSRGRKAVPW